MKLSILIPSTYDRGEMTNQLTRYLEFLTQPYASDIEILVAMDDKTMSIGEKRDRLYASAKGEYAWQIDSDDMVSLNSVDQIMAVLKNESPDCIGFKERAIMNGKLYTSNHSNKYLDWGENEDGFDFVRTIFMKDVVKTEIAQSVPVLSLRYAEDIDWSRRLKHHLKTEHYINDFIYYYEHESSEFKTRYGFDKD